MTFIGAQPGVQHTVNRGTIFTDVIELYKRGGIIDECPLWISYDTEIAVDEGGVTRDMFSAFWEAAYSHLFEGATLLTPLLHPQTDMGMFPVLGKIISHGYLVSGYLPVRVSLPSLLIILLGPSIDIPRSFLLDALLDYVSENEREKLKSALRIKDVRSFPSTEMKHEVISVLSRLGCRDVPTPTNLPQLIINVAKYEFCTKAAAAASMMHSGIPDKHRKFWIEMGVDGISSVYACLTVTSDKILSVLESDPRNPAEERVYGYLTSMIGNMGVNDLRNFLRFTTGSSVCVTRKIEVLFCSTSGFARRPFAHTCSSTLQLPVAYVNFHDFYSEWQAVLSDTDSDWKWRMDGV